MQSEYTYRCRKATGMIIPNSFKGSKLWKLDGDKLQNKAFPYTWTGTCPTWDINGMTMQDNFDKWNFKTKDDLIYIEDISNKKFLQSSNDGNVFWMDFEENKPQQLWKRGEPNSEGYFSLKNYISQNFMTATSATTLEVKGKLSRRWIVNCLFL